MTDKPISRYPVPALEDMPEDLREMMLGMQEKVGFIPNVFWRWRIDRMSCARSSLITMP